MLLLLLACTADAPKPDTASDPDDTAGTDTADTTDSGDTAESPYAEAFETIRRAARSDLRGGMATGASVAIWKDGEVIFAEGFGTRHPDTEDPVLPSTLFQIGSDTKKMTAIAALQQVHAGRLSLDDTIADVIPELVFATDPTLAGEITLHELLSHQTGLFDYTPWVDAPEDSDLADRALGRFAENEFAMGPSGLYWNYSNPGFSTAGLLTEVADGRAWADILEDDLFAPLGLTRTFARQADAIADGDHAIGNGINLTNGYDTFDPLSELGYTVGTVEVENTLDCGFTRPAGLVWSTASDMARFAGFLVDGDPSVLPDELLALVETPHVAMYPAMDAADFGYGYGLMVNNDGWNGFEGFYDDVPLWAHGGNTMSMTSTFFAVPEQRVAVVVLSNGYGDDFSTTAVKAIEALAELPTPTEAPSLLNPPANLEDAAGTWVDPWTAGTLEISWDGATLQVAAPDLEAAGHTVGDELEPYAEDLYFLRVNGADYDLNLYRDADGTAYLVNRQFTFIRSADIAARPAPPAYATLPRPGLDPRAPMTRLLAGQAFGKP
jgi:CubicO group peptidase (beta-lactamase class C family)